MPAKRTATGTSTAGRSRVTTALRKASGVVATATGRGSTASGKSTAKKTTTKKTSKKAATKAAAKKTTATKASATKSAPAKKASTKSPAKKIPAKKAAATKAAAGKTAAKAPAKKTPTKKTSAGKTAAKAPAKKTPTKKTPTKKTAAGKPAPTRKAASVKQSATKATPAKAAPAKKTTATKTTAKKATKAPGAPRKLKVRDDESPWTAQELAAVRAELENDVERLTQELSGFEDDIAGLIKDSGDGAGDDQADTGAKTFEREHEASLAQNSRDLLEQSIHALQRIDDGTYGVCENCGNAIGKLRLQAFPRATLCLNCKAKQERR